jgi:Rps23 Pro-64 3,4-dihydroxylase Tpa1-like proline 4-hydroxylase
MIHTARFLDEATADALHDALAGEPWRLSARRLGDFALRFHHRAIAPDDRSVFGAVRARIAALSDRPVDAHASWYGPGCFLSAHDDAGPDETREQAWVLHMARDWHAEHGGLLRFAGGETIVPGFNMLTLFDVPREHEVTSVAADAPAGRYALAGWFKRR